MTTSGTTSFNLAFDDIFLLAISKSGGDPSSADELRRAKEKMDLLLLDLSNRNLLLHKLDEITVTCSVSQGIYDIGTSVQDVYLANVVFQNRDLELNRDSIEDFFKIPNKQQTGRPTTFYVDRDLLGTYVNVWPLPNASTYQLRLKVHKLPENVGAAWNTIDVPVRFMPAIVAQLAFDLAFSREGVDPTKLAALKLEAEEKTANAFGEDRDRASTFIIPGGRHR